MKKKRTQTHLFLLMFIGFVFLFLIWYLVSYLLLRSGNSLLPYPHEVFVSLIKVSFYPEMSQTTWTAVGWTLFRLILGFFVSFILGALLGTLGGLFKGFGAFMAPGVTLARSVPTAAVVLVLVGIVYGYGNLAEFIPSCLVLLVAFPLIYEAFRSGIQSESQEVVDALRLDCGARSMNAVVSVYWPDSLPFISLSLIQSLGLSLKVSIMSEIIVSGGVRNGLGTLIRLSKENLEMDKTIAYSLLAVIFIALVDITIHVVKSRLKKQ